MNDNSARLGQETEQPVSEKPAGSWPESRESRGFRIRALIAIVILAAAVGGEFITGRLSELFNLKDPNPTFVTLVLTAAVGAFILNTYRIYRDKFEDRQTESRAERLQTDEEKAASKSTDGSLALADLWKVNQEQLRYYHDIATKQSQRSFRNGQVAAYAGFATLIAVAFVAATAQNGTAAIAASVIGVAGAGLSGFIGATFMRSQSEASKQLQQFFSQPVEVSRMLGAERLIESLPSDARTGAVREVIVRIMTDAHPIPNASESPPTHNEVGNSGTSD